MSLNKKLKRTDLSPKINLKIDNQSHNPIDSSNINDSHDLDTTCSTYN